MADSIELVKSTNGYAGGPLGNSVVVYIGEPSINHPNILVKTPLDFPKILLSEGAKKNMKAKVHINRRSTSNLSEEDSKILAERISGQMRKEGFFNCTFALNFVHSSPKVKVEGKSVQMFPQLGAHAYSNSANVQFGQATSQQKLLGHELTHVVQQ